MWSSRKTNSGTNRHNSIELWAKLPNPVRREGMFVSHFIAPEARNEHSCQCFSALH